MFNNVKISVRVISAFVVLTLLSAAVAGFSIFRVDQLKNNLKTMNEFNSVKQRYAINFRGSVHDRAISVRDVVLVETPANQQKALDEIASLEAAYEASAVKMDQIFSSSDRISQTERDILTSIKEIEAVTVPIYEDVVRLKLAGDAEAARQLLIESASADFSEWLKRINQFIDYQEAKNGAISANVDQKVKSFGFMVFGILALGGVLALIMCLWCAGALRNLRDLSESMRRISEGEIEAPIPTVPGTNEVGNMAHSLEFFRESLKRSKAMESENEKLAEKAEAEKREALNQLADNFQANVEGVVNSVHNAAQQMTDFAKKLGMCAASANEKSSNVASTSQETSSNVETVAAASEEMSASLAEVSQRVSHSATMVETAAQKTHATTQTVSKLSTSAQTIGDIISMISDIAEQTNLLALNATIEAARAGEAGRGFAVVASEVKGLAGQTAKATEQISSQILQMQTDTHAVVDAIQDVGNLIQELTETSTSIASAVEQQYSTTQEIAKNTLHAAEGTRVVTTNIGQVTDTIVETEETAAEVMSASSELAAQAQHLNENVAKFLEGIRAA